MPIQAGPTMPSGLAKPKWHTEVIWVDRSSDVTRRLTAVIEAPDAKGAESEALRRWRAGRTGKIMQVNVAAFSSPIKRMRFL